MRDLVAQQLIILSFSFYEFKPQKPEFAVYQKINSKGVKPYHNVHLLEYQYFQDNQCINY